MIKNMTLYYVVESYKDNDSVLPKVGPFFLKNEAFKKRDLLEQKERAIVPNEIEFSVVETIVHVGTL
jgi:hypothetical protein